MFQIEDAWIHASQTAIARLCGRPTVRTLPFIEMPNWGMIFVVEFVPADDQVEGIPRRFAIFGTNYLLGFCKDSSMLDLRVWILGFEDSPWGKALKEVVGIFTSPRALGGGYVLAFNDGSAISDNPWLESAELSQEHECIWRQRAIPD